MVSLFSTAFAAVTFNIGTGFTDLDNDTGMVVGQTFGVNFDLNKTTTLGYDSELGMLGTFDVPFGAELRMGWDNNGSSYSVGLGYNWWTGGEAIKTTVGTAIDYSTAGGGNDDTAIRVNVGFGF